MLHGEEEGKGEEKISRYLRCGSDKRASGTRDDVGASCARSLHSKLFRDTHYYFIILFQSMTSFPNAAGRRLTGALVDVGFLLQ
jgi:hypothetical protein